MQPSEQRGYNADPGPLVPWPQIGCLPPCILLKMMKNVRKYMNFIKFDNPDVESADRCQKFIQEHNGTGLIPYTCNSMTRGTL